MATFLDCPLFDAIPRNIGAFTRSSLLGPPSPAPVVSPFAAVSLPHLVPFSSPPPLPPLHADSPPPRVPLPGDPSTDDTGPTFTPIPFNPPRGLPAYSAPTTIVRRSSLLPVNSLDYGSPAPPVPPAPGPAGPGADRPEPPRDDSSAPLPRIILDSPTGSTEPPIYAQARNAAALAPIASSTGPNVGLLIAGGIAIAAVVGGFFLVLRRK